MKRMSTKEKEYQKWKEEVARPFVISTDGNKCMCCGRWATVGEKLDLDHILGKGSHPELKRSLENLQLLDRDCHYYKTNYSWLPCPHNH